MQRGKFAANVFDLGIQNIYSVFQHKPKHYRAWSIHMCMHGDAILTFSKQLFKCDNRGTAAKKVLTNVRK